MDMAEESHYSSTSHGVNNLDKLKPGEDGLSQPESTALERTVWRKLDAWLLPLCTSFFLLAFLDRVNIGNARVAGLQRSLVMSNHEYAVTLTITNVPFIVAELPSTLLLKYVGPNLMFPAMVALWGVASASQGFVDDYSGLLACRFFLGLMEGGLFPGMILYLSTFYPRKWLQIRIAVFYASSSLAGAFSGLLATAIDQINGKGGKPGWAWIFILEGGFSCLFGVISFFLLPRSPAAARFLKDKEQAYVISVLKHSGSVAEDDKRDSFSWSEVVGTARSLHVWLLAVILFLSGTILFGLTYFEPTIVSELGYKSNHAQLMSVPPFATAFALSLISAVLSDRYQCRGCVAIFFSLLQLVGLVLFYASTSSHVRYGSFFLFVPGTYCAAPALVTWLANNSAPHVRRATAVAVGSIMTQSGGVLSTWLLGSLSPAPEYTMATLTFIVMSACIVIFSTANLVYLQRENRLKAERRQRTMKEDEPEELGDRSAWFIYNL